MKRELGWLAFYAAFIALGTWLADVWENPPRWVFGPMGGAILFAFQIVCSAILLAAWTFGNLRRLRKKSR
jgi:hypothetical protein